MALRKIREDCNVGLNELAKNIGVSPAYLSELERGIRNNPTKEIMDKIASALGHTVQEIFYADEIKNVG